MTWWWRPLAVCGCLAGWTVAIGYRRCTTAKHALYLLHVLAVLVLTLEAKIEPAVYTAVGGLLVSRGEVRGALEVSGPQSCPFSVGRVLGGYQPPRDLFFVRYTYFTYLIYIYNSFVVHLGK